MNNWEECIELAVVSFLCGLLFSVFFMKKFIVPENVNVFSVGELQYENLIAE